MTENKKKEYQEAFRTAIKEIAEGKYYNENAEFCRAEITDKIELTKDELKIIQLFENNNFLQSDTVDKKQALINFLKIIFESSIEYKKEDKVAALRSDENVVFPVVSVIKDKNCSIEKIISNYKDTHMYSVLNSKEQVNHEIMGKFMMELLELQLKEYKASDWTKIGKTKKKIHKKIDSEPLINKITSKELEKRIRELEKTMPITAIPNEQKDNKKEKSNKIKENISK